jgi:protein-tyrosine phosphatase
MSIINVIDNIYLGNWKSTNADTLRTNNISHVLHAGFFPDEKLENVSYCHINIDDNSQSANKLFDMLPQLHQQIKDKTKQDNVLVACSAGRSRSATIVISYLMKEYKLPYPEAFNLINKKRDINPNPTFKNKLKKLNYALLSK